MDPLTRRMAWTASVAAAVTGALIALGAAVFATVAGHAPSVGGLVALVGGSGVLFAVVALVLVTRVTRVRRALGLEPIRPRLP
ncbi:MAG: hypothetical protein AB7O78_04605 [Thermoleophilia bacterium]